MPSSTKYSALLEMSGREIRRVTSSPYLALLCITLRALTSYCSFGFLDGISHPAVKDVDTKPNPGQETVSQGIILLGRVGDVTTRPSWALDGSFLAFRYLFQLVPEFDAFLKHNPVPGVAPELGSELLGARMVGRWKSGTWSCILVLEI